jgi:hypothetical protein
MDIALDKIVAVSLLNEAAFQIHYENGPFDEAWLEFRERSRRAALIFVHDLRLQIEQAKRICRDSEDWSF